MQDLRSVKWADQNINIDSVMENQTLFKYKYQRHQSKTCASAKCAFKLLGGKKAAVMGYF